MDRPHRLLVVAAFAAVYLVWGSTYLAIRIGLETLPPLLMAGVRFLVAGALVYGYCRATGAARPRLVEWRDAAIVGLCLMAGGNGLVTWAQQWVPSSVAALLVATMPLSMTLLSSLFFGGQRPGKVVLAGIALGLFGVGILVRPDGVALGGVDPLGALLLVMATLFWAGGSLYSRDAHLPRSPFLSAGMEMLAGGAALLLGGTLAGEWPRVDLGAVSGASLSALVYLVVMGSIVTLTAYVWLLRVVSATAVSTYAFVNPVVAVVLGWAFAGEQLSARVGIATALITASVAVILWARARFRDVPSAAAPRRESVIAGNAAAEAVADASR